MGGGRLREVPNTIEPPVNDLPKCQAKVVAYGGGRLRERPSKHVLIWNVNLNACIA